MPEPLAGLFWPVTRDVSHLHHVLSVSFGLGLVLNLVMFPFRTGSDPPVRHGSVSTIILLLRTLNPVLVITLGH